MKKLITKIKELETKHYNLKTKTAKSKCKDKIDILKRDVNEILYNELNKYGPCSVKGKVLWVDSDGSMYIETVYGKLYSYVCSDVLSKSWYNNTCCIEYIVGQEVIVNLDFELGKDYTINIVVGKLVGGKVNEERYQELCKDTKLAFFKYPERGMSGLFA